MLQLAIVGILLTVGRTAFNTTNSTFKENVVCYKITWQVGSETCASTDTDLVLYLDESVCTGDKVCQYSNDQSIEGICATDTSGVETLYPGDDCDSSSSDQICTTGQCVDEKCLGFGPFAYCDSTSEWSYGLYWSKHMCMTVRQPGEWWDHQDAWGRLGFCWYGFERTQYDFDINSGTWVSYFSLDNGERVAPANATATYRVNDLSPNLNLLWRSGVIDPQRGECHNGHKSQNAMERCDVSSDCPTDEDGVNVDWICGLNASGDKFWDYGPADFLWIRDQEKFKVYYMSTLGWHAGAGWSEWGVKSIWEDWKWANAKAVYAVETISNPDCVDEYSLNIEAISELENYWGSSWRENYLEDSSSSNSVIVALTGLLLLL